MAAATVNPCDDNIFSQILKGNAIVCNQGFQDLETYEGESQIQSVADNARKQADAGEIPPISADVAQTAADMQAAQTPDDTSNVSSAVAASTAGQIFTTCPDGNGGISIPGLPCIDYNYIIYGVIGLIVLYVVMIVASFVPRPK